MHCTYQILFTHNIYIVKVNFFHMVTKTDASCMRMVSTTPFELCCITRHGWHLHSKQLNMHNSWRNLLHHISDKVILIARTVWIRLTCNKNKGEQMLYKWILYTNKQEVVFTDSKSKNRMTSQSGSWISARYEFPGCTVDCQFFICVFNAVILPLSSTRNFIQAFILIGTEIRHINGYKLYRPVFHASVQLHYSDNFYTVEEGTK